MLGIIYITARDIGYGVAEKLRSEGNLVKLLNLDGYTVEETDKGIKRIASLWEHEEAADLIVFRSPAGAGVLADQLAKRGRVVVGASGASDIFLRDEEVRSTFLRMMQRKLDESVEVWVCVWFVEGEPKLIFLSQLDSRLLAEDIGPKVYPDMGATVVQISGSKLAREFSKDLESVLSDYTGLARFNLNVDAEGYSVNLYSLDLGCTELPAVVELLGKRFSRFIIESLTKDLILSNNNVALSVRVDYNNGDLNVPEQAKKHFWPDKGRGFVSAWGQDVNEARRRVRRTLENSLTSSDPVYRRDAGHKAADCFNQLITWGWIDAIENGRFAEGSVGKHRRVDRQLQEDGEAGQLKSQGSSEGEEAGNSNSLL